MSAAPMGMPGWPELACWTASMAKARIALAIRFSLSESLFSAGSIRPAAVAGSTGVMTSLLKLAAATNTIWLMGVNGQGRVSGAGPPWLTQHPDAALARGRHRG